MEGGNYGRRTGAEPRLLSGAGMGRKRAKLAGSGALPSSEEGGIRPLAGYYGNFASPTKWE